MRYPYTSWQAFAKEKIIELKPLLEKIELLRSQNQTIATINGSFDLLHAGHMHILYEASLTADLLVVALNTDSSVQRYKSPDRPIIPLTERMGMVAALGIVDFVTWFAEDDPRNLLAQIRPDVHVNGAEYGDDCIEAEIVKKHGGKIHLVPRIPALSTSSIISTIQCLCD